MTLKEAIKAKAKANRVKSGTDFGKGLEKSRKPIIPVHTDKEIANLAGVSDFTIRQAETILKDGTPEQV